MGAANKEIPVQAWQITDQRMRSSSRSREKLTPMQGRHAEPQGKSGVKN